MYIITPRKLPLLFLLLSLNLVSFAQKKNFTVNRTEPIWLEKITTTDQKLANRDIQEGYYLSLFEQQNNVESKEQYRHTIREIASDNGVQNGSEISITYDPSYQQLIFHKVVIWRNNQQIDKLNAQNFKVIQNEKDLSRFIYSGTYDAYLILDDVRKGDRIEYSYTLRGENPVFGNNYANTFYFEWGSKIVNIYTNVIAKKDRVLQFKNFNTVPPIKTKQRGDLQIYEWQSKLTNTFKSQDFEPSWYDPFARVQVSEYKSWRDIVDWAIQINNYDLSNALTFNNKVKELKAKAKGNPTTYLELATRFVQDEVRYMGIEMGEYSHRPNSPEKVLKQRYGDCKDKSILLINLLKANGISAFPVYLNTYLKDKTKELMPTPIAFNHAVVVVEFEGRKIWIDPTISDQRGSIKDIYFPYNANVLVIKPGNNQLEPVKPSPKGKLSSVSIIKLADTAGKKPTELDIKSTYTANYADDIRSEINSSGANDLEKNFLEYYTRFYPGIAPVKNMEIIDDEKNNIITIIEKYEIEDIWERDDSVAKKISASFYGDMVSSELRKLNKGRNFPLALKYPVNVHQVVKVVLPEDGWNFDNEEGGIDRPNYNFKYSITQERDTLKLTYSYANLTEEVPSEAIGQYIKDRSKIIGDISYSIFWSEKDTSIDIAEQNGLMITIGIFTLIVAIAICIFIYSRKQAYNLEEIKNSIPIGGWLIFLAIGLVISPIRLLVDIFDLKTFEQSVWDVANNLSNNEQILYKGTHIFETIANISMLVFSCLLVVLFFQRRKILPKFFIYFKIFCIAITIIDLTLISILNTHTSLEFDQSKSSAYFFVQVVFSAIWIAYFLKSTRVKQTFVYTYPSSEWRYALIMDLSRNINVPISNPSEHSIQEINEQTHQENNERL